ncbi:hypothetical protein BCV70DRAFT_203259 [Testicularia cyperi]|uniref:Peptidase S54 rhomboid domain-containing protein n=1 Tax=Testicularia cyperi TaxID=1882483 RepID=A0A317XGJ1_9BASI|nr:hypothetical protein BCV70DRAFT_203259 [Testicularia cyperi]
MSVFRLPGRRPTGGTISSTLLARPRCVQSPIARTIATSPSLPSRLLPARPSNHRSRSRPAGPINSHFPPGSDASYLDPQSQARLDAFRAHVNPPPPPPQPPQQPGQDHDQELRSDVDWKTQRVAPPSSARAIAFLLGFTALSFGGAAYYSLKDTEHVAAELRSSRDVFANITSFFSSKTTGDDVHGADIWGTGVTERRLLIAKKHEIAERLGRRMEWIVGWCDQLGLPSGLTQAVGRSYVMVADAYLELPTSKQVLVPIIAFNTLVFAAWTLSPFRSRMHSFLVRNFMHRPSSGRNYTMLTSTFSHQGGLHFLFNNFALWSIGGSALIYASHINYGQPLVPEASRTPHFLSFFATAGVFAATVSHIATSIRFRRVAAIRGIEHAMATVGRQRSLGASGAVYAALVMSACAFPDARVSLIFLPFVSMPIGYGVGGLVLVDMAGVVLRWGLFDHWAHLGGALFGYLYFYHGPQFWEAVKKHLIHRFRIGIQYAA